MPEESKTRRDIRNACSQILYENERYLIGTDSRRTEGHYVLVNDAYAFLDRGILGELARADAQRLESSLRMVGEAVLYEMREKHIPLEDLGWALAKASIKDLEEFARFLSQQTR